MKDPMVYSPSAWSYRESQENGDEVACQGCGNALDDDHPITNDDEGFAYHLGCLPATQAKSDEEIHAKAVDLHATDDVDVLSVSVDRIDGGAWVSALVWVPDDAWDHPRCRVCGSGYLEDEHGARTHDDEGRDEHHHPSPMQEEATWT